MTDFETMFAAWPNSQIERIERARAAWGMLSEDERATAIVAAPAVIARWKAQRRRMFMSCATFLETKRWTIMLGEAGAG